jgi:hypothetical protein
MKQQTAVEWLIDQLISLDKELEGRRKNEDATVLKLNPTKLFEQAKEMDKEQKIDAHIEGQRVFDKHDHTQWTTKQAEKYYNETYKL